MFESSRNLMLSLLITYLITSNALTLKKEKSIIYSRITILGLFISSLVGYNTLYVKSIGKGIGIYGGLFHVTSFTQCFNIFLLIVSSLILVITSFYPRKVVLFDSSIISVLLKKFIYNKNFISNKAGEQFSIIEYSLIMIFVITGGIFLMSASDLVSMFLSIELQSYGLYIISTVYRDSEKATNGGLMYFLLGGLSSCFILLGSSLIYVNAGTTSLDGLYLINSIYDKLPYIGLVEEASVLNNWYNPYYIDLSLIILCVGFLFKISAAPFHFWSPDVYDGIPTKVTTFVAIVAKISIFAFFLELVHYTKNDYSYSWVNILLISSLASLIIGSILGLTQFRIKRLYAYSTISHVGFILLALSINSIESIQAYILYIITYTISNLNAFIILLSIGYSLYLYVYIDEKHKNNLKEVNNSTIQLIDQIKGYFYVNPYISLSLTITLFSFVGVPPLVGFFAKQMVLSAALDYGYVFMSIIAVLTSVIGAVYYLNLIKQVFFYKLNYEINPDLDKVVLKGKSVNIISSKKDQSENFVYNLNNIALSSGLSVTISTLSLFLITFMFIPDEWFRGANILSLILFQL